LLSFPQKVFARLSSSNRIKPTLLSHMWQQQNGYAPGCSTCNRILTLNNVAQRLCGFSHLTYAAYVDICVLLSNLSAAQLLLKRLGVPDKIMYDKSSSCVRVGGLHSSLFEIMSGVC